MLLYIIIGKYNKSMEKSIIYHERRPNYMATIKSLDAGDEVFFPWDRSMSEPLQIRVICSKLEGKFTVNKTVNGMRVTRSE